MIIKTFRCKNSSCEYHVNPLSINVPEETNRIPCFLCGSSMNEVESGGWLEEIGKDNSLWDYDILNSFPAVISHEYSRLKNLCVENDAFGVLFAIKDNYEAVLKLETLLAYAWASKEMDDIFEKEIISQLTTPNLSLGAWVELAGILVKGIKRSGREMPSQIPLDDLRKKFAKKEIVNWRNEKIGHGALGFKEDEDFRSDIREKIETLHNILLSVKDHLIEQKLYMVDKGTGEKIVLVGEDRARNLPFQAEVFFNTSDGILNLSVDPFIVIRKHQKKGYGVYFFDTQRTLSVTQLMAYAEGSCSSETIGYFTKLRRLFEEGKVQAGIRPDDRYLTEDENRQLDLLQMSDGFAKPKHIVEWLKNCVLTYDKGIFLLQMERGTGKSVFTEKINRLFEKPLIISDDLDVRTYHFGRSQSAGITDIRSYIEWMWSKEYNGNTWIRIPRFSDFERKGMSCAEALCELLKNVKFFSETNRNVTKIMMVLDGLDEISNESLWEFIPTEDMLSKGIFIFLTSRIPDKEELPDEVYKKINEITVTVKNIVSKENSDNKIFLMDYIQKTDIKNLSQKNKEQLIELSGFRVLQLGLLCRLIQHGIPITQLPDSGKVISSYLEVLDSSYGERESIYIHEVLAVLCTLGKLQPLTLNEIGAITREGYLTLHLIGVLRDLAPLIKVERSEGGNRYSIINEELAKELSIQLPETESVVRWMVNISMSEMRDKQNVIGTCYEPEVAYVVELSRIIPEGIDAMGEDANNVLESYINMLIELPRNVFTVEKLALIKRQLYLYNKCRFGNKHRKSINALHSWAHTLQSLGKYEETIEKYRCVYEFNKELLGERNLDTLRSLSDLSTAVDEAGRHKEALENQEMIYRINKEELGENHHYTLTALQNYSFTLCEVGRYKEALEKQESIYRIRKEMLGERHIETMGICKDMSVTLERIGMYKEALVNREKVCKFMREELGEQHPITLAAKNDLACSLSMMGKYEDALEMFINNYNECKEVFGKWHLSTLATLNNTACMLDNLGRYEEALEKYKEVYMNESEVLGKRHPDTLISLGNMASVLDNLGKYKEALEMQEEVLRQRSEVLGKKHPDTLVAVDNLECTLEKLGRDFDSLEDRENIYYIRKDALGEKHPDTLNALDNLATTLDALNKHNEALEKENELYELRKEVLGDRNLTTILTLGIIAAILNELGRYEEALDKHIMVYTLQKEILGENNPNTLKSLEFMAITLIELGRYEEALEKENKIYESRKILLGNNHPDTLRVLEMMTKINKLI